MKVQCAAPGPGPSGAWAPPALNAEDDKVFGGTEP